MTAWTRDELRKAVAAVDVARLRAIFQFARRPDDARP
jgi:hypothetical protein